MGTGTGFTDTVPENTDANAETMDGPTKRKLQPGDYEDIKQQRKRQHEDEDILPSIEASLDRGSLTLGLENMYRSPKRELEHDEPEHEEERRKSLGQSEVFIPIEEGQDPEILNASPETVERPPKQEEQPGEGQQALESDPAPIREPADSATRPLIRTFPCTVKHEDGSLFRALTEKRQKRAGQKAYITFYVEGAGASPKLKLQLGNGTSSIKLEANWGINDYEENEWVMNKFDMFLLGNKDPDSRRIRRLCPHEDRDRLICVTFEAWSRSSGPYVRNDTPAEGVLDVGLQEIISAMFRPRFQYLLRIWFFYDCMDKPFMTRCTPSFLNAVRSRVKPDLLAAQEHEIAANEREVKERMGENQNRKEQAKGDARNLTRRAKEIADEYAIGKAKETPKDQKTKMNIHSLLN